MRKIVVCATQRSGSSMVCEDLARTRVLGWPEEWFLPWRPNPDKDWQAELDAVYAKGCTPNGVFSVKIMANQLKAVDQCLGTFIEGGGGSHPHLLAQFSGASWVWVRRRDTLGQAISHFLAQKSGVYHVNTQKTEFRRGSSVHAERFDEVVGDEVPYDFQAINKEWHILKQHDFVWEQFFAANRIDPLVIWYEDASEHPVGSQVAEHAGFGPVSDAEHRAYGKLPSGRNDVIRERFIADLFMRH